MGYKTANSIEKEVTFYCKLRTELALNTPYYYGYNSSEYSNIYGNGSGVLLKERKKQYFDSNSSDSQDNKVHQLVDFGSKIGDWNNSYNDGVWTVSTTKDWQIDLDLRLQMDINGNYNDYLHPFRNDIYKGEINGGIVGMIRLYKLPASSSSVIPIGGRFNADPVLGLNPFVSVPDIIELERKDFAIIYNQNQNNLGNDFNAGIFVNGTGSINRQPTFNQSFIQTGINYTWNGEPGTTASSDNDPNSGYNEGEYYSTWNSWYSIDTGISDWENDFNRISLFSGVNSDNLYSINTTQNLEIGDRVFVVVSGSFNQFANDINSQPNPSGGINGINNQDRSGGIIYQWNGSVGPNKKNQPVPAIGHLHMKEGSFKTKTVL